MHMILYVLTKHRVLKGIITRKLKKISNNKRIAEKNKKGSLWW